MMDAGANLSSFGAGERAMGQGGSKVLTSWKAVATYMGKGVRTVQRWEQDFGLPVRRPSGSDKRAVIAFAHDLDTWVALRCTRSQPARAAGDSDPASMQQRIETAMALRTANRLLLNEMKVALASLRFRLAAMSSTASSVSAPAGSASTRLDLPNTRHGSASTRPMGAELELFARADRKQKIDGGKLVSMPVTLGIAVEQPSQDAAGSEYLQSIIEMQEAMNEELQSMNEELQISREELESANDALHRVNEEMLRRNDLATQRNDLQTQRNDGVVLTILDRNVFEEMPGSRVPLPATRRAGKKSHRAKQ